MSASRSSIISLLGRATSRTLASAVILLPLCFIVGGLGHAVMWQAGLMAIPFAGSNPQSQLIYSELTKIAVGIVWGNIAFPFLNAVAIYCWKKEPAGAINWALSRYSKMFGPHLAAYTTISLGMIIIVPGILFGLQYAFVSAISATDDKATAPVARSAKLTAGRRGRIFRAWVPYALWYLPAYLVLVYKAEGEGWLAVLAFGTFDVLLLTVMEMVMFGLYEERIEDARAAREAKEAAGSIADGGAAPEPA